MQRAIVLEGEKNIRYFAKMVDDDKAEMILRNRENRIVYQVIITNPKFIMRQFDYH